ncbi:MAG TPA: hypothetical protein VFI17_13885 [Solirubrobacterales bacterium]|nr:hypothetical protein [Solirubrobacterales bacterium]
MAAPRLALTLACLSALAAFAAGCGGDSATQDAAPSGREDAVSRPAPPASEFPSVQGRTLREVVKAADGPAESLVRPGAQVFEVGANRYPFTIIDHDLAPLSDVEAAVYLAKVPAPKPGAHSKAGNRGAVAKAQMRALDEPAVGPFPVAIETLATDPRFEAESTAADPDAATVVYSVQLDFPEQGEWLPAVILKEGGELRGKLLPSIIVGEFEKIPRVGQRAPLIHTPTAQDVGGDLSKITTRIPPDTMNKVDYAEALGKKPIVLLFATPKFCQSRVCGPVVDVAEQAQHEYGDKADFIHMEIYKNNDPAQHPLPQVRAFRLPTEPWLFTIDRKGRIAAAIEGAFGLKLMHEAVEKAIAE